MEKDRFPYIINGLGGRSNSINSIYRFLSFSRSPYSRVRYNQDYGAMLVTANPSCINFSFYDRQRNLIDSLTLSRGDE